LYDGINENGQGLTQTKLKKFLFIVLILAEMYPIHFYTFVLFFCII
jgi:hypothetical protein